MKVRHPKIASLSSLARAGIRFPPDVDYCGIVYYSTGKFGTERSTGRPVAEYAPDQRAARLWLFSDGTVADNSEAHE